MADNVTQLPRGLSIQGEQQKDLGFIQASDADVDLYVDRVSDEVLAGRERGRHLFASIRQAGIHFSAVDETGLLIRRLTCTSCGLAVRVEKWEGARRGGRTRFQRVTSSLEYRTGRDGETYLAPSGRGRMTTRQIGDSVASKALEGQSVTALRKAARASHKTTKDTHAQDRPAQTPPSHNIPAGEIPQKAPAKAAFKAASKATSKTPAAPRPARKTRNAG